MDIDYKSDYCLTKVLQYRTWLDSIKEPTSFDIFFLSPFQQQLHDNKIQNLCFLRRIKIAN